MDNTDKQLLTLLQRDFPVEPEPFAVLAERIGVSEDDVIARIESLRREGYIRRIGASLDPRKLGYTSTLAAARVPPDKIDSAVEYINSFPQITHNYERDDEFNIWFTVIARDEAVIAAILDGILRNTGADEILNLPATHLFKIKVSFDLTE